MKYSQKIMIERFFLTLVRHGETMENRESVIQGQADTALSDLGRKQARLAGKRLKYERFTHVFSSDLSRAADTAQAIVDANQVSNCILVKDKRLRERSFGIMQGKSFAELQDMLKERKLSYKSYTPEGGESIEQVTSRASSFFKEICNIVASLVSEPQVPTPNQNSQVGHISGTNQPMETSKVNDNENGVQGLSSNGNSISTNATTSHPTLQDTSKCLSVDTEGGGASSSSSMTSSITSSGPHPPGQLKNERQTDISILIVSHGLWIREFKKVILNRYKGNIPEDITFLMNRVSPNTGVSKFAMCVSAGCQDGSKSVKCVECCFLDCKSHLRSLESDEVAGSKY